MSTDMLRRLTNCSFVITIIIIIVQDSSNPTTDPQQYYFSCQFGKVRRRGRQLWPNKHTNTNEKNLYSR